MRKVLKWIAVVLGVLVVLAIGLLVYVQLAWARPYDRPVSEMTAPTDQATIARGEYLYKYGWQCWGCHSQGTAGPDAPQAGGQEFDLGDVGPGFGVFYVPNITPDPETGIGAWSDGELVRTMREGVDREGRAVFPIMGREFLKGLSDQDALALVAYLRSIPPVKNQATPSRPSLAAKALLTFKIVKPQPAITQPVTAPPAGPTIEYGAYLATHGSACAECHTPVDLQSLEYFLDQLFSGGAIAMGGELEGLPAAAYPTNITPHRETGIGDWSEEQFITAMRTGARPNGTVMLTVMPYPYYGFWTDDDLKAVYRYLMTMPAIENQVPGPEFMPEITAGDSASKGAALFQVYCAACHGENGAGAEPTSQALAEVAPTLDDMALQGFIDAGIAGTWMPGFGKTLTDEQIADLLAYITTFK
ncbi:MAG: c-type cytochrome [Anaerolineae bacterium]